MPTIFDPSMVRKSPILSCLNVLRCRDPNSGPEKRKRYKSRLDLYLFDAGARSRQREGTGYDWRHWQGLRAILSSLGRLVELASQSVAIRLFALLGRRQQQWQAQAAG